MTTTIGEKINTREEAELLLAEIMADRADLALKTAALDVALTAVRRIHEPAIAMLALKIAGDRMVLECWAWEVKDVEFKEPKSIAMLHGVVGFAAGRPSIGLMAKENWVTVLAKLKGKWKKYIRIKPEVDRAQLLKDATRPEKPIGTAELSKLGLKIVQEESFYIEPKA